jgi:hypothetical protein
MHYLQKIRLFIFLIALFCFQQSYAGPPFLTEDPDVMDPGNSLLTLYATGDKGKNYTSYQAPAVEFDNGVIHNVEVDIYLAFLTNVTGTLILGLLGDNTL